MRFFIWIVMLVLGAVLFSWGRSRSSYGFSDDPRVRGAKWQRAYAIAEQLGPGFVIVSFGMLVAELLRAC